MSKYKRLFMISRNGINILLTCAVLGMVFAAGLFCILKFSSTAADQSLRTRIAAIIFMIALSSHLVGWLLGFLFGIPRVVQEEEKEVGVNSKYIYGNYGRAKYRVNTNIENVSDWLTKILVGVGLTQFNNIKGYLVYIAHYFSVGMSSVENIEQMITATIVYYLINGFFSGYFLTRLFFSGAFFQAEESMSIEHLEMEDVERSKIHIENLSQPENNEKNM